MIKSKIEGRLKKKRKKENLMTTLDIYWMYHVSHAEAVPSVGCLGLALGLAITRDDGPCSGVISEPGTV